MNCNSTETISTERLKRLGTKTEDWKGSDKFGNVFERTDWEKVAEGLDVHERCYITLSSKRSLQQSWKGKEKENAEKIPTIHE